MADNDYKQGRDTELVLPPGVFAFVQDNTKGNINTYCGPYKSSLSNTDQLVTYNAETKKFVPARDQQSAIQTNVLVPKGSYVILENPANNGKQPEAGKTETMLVGSLKMGQIENLSGPQSFPLWPGQNATVVKGHNLRSNQYLLVRVYDDEEAKRNWDKSVVKGATSEIEKKDVLGINKDNLITGQIIVIEGEEVAFYIPPTGIEVLVDENGRYIRDAVTLERLEYSILLGESGEKEYIIGPAVVFPTPTQQFYTKDGARKFRAQELQPTTGMHIKVTADYKDDKGVEHKAGDELFITGADMPIYYPRDEHATITYGGFEKSFAVAIPSGEGRYVLDRESGDINLVEGPKMFLPNPIKEVVVRRTLTPSECDLYYPGNDEVKRINDELRDSNPSNQYGTSAPVAGSGLYNSLESALEDTRLRTRSFVSMAYSDAPREAVGKGLAGDNLNRGTKYTPPRTITLNTKYDGALRIDVWSGFAIQVVNSQGDRRTVVGPQTVLLQYDEYLERLSLSKGKPKNPDNRMNTAFLRYISNPVSDILNLKTQDLVNVNVQVKYLVRFEAEAQSKWFSVDNYVQYMVDHLRSLIGNAVRNIGVQELYTNATNILRDVVLGKKPEDAGNRPLKNFTENGMTVYDLELISIEVKDAAVSELLSKSRQETLTDSIELDRQKTKLTLVQGQEVAKRAIATELAATQKLKDVLDADQQERASEVRLAQAEQEAEILLSRKNTEKKTADITAEIQTVALETDRNRKDMEQVYADAEALRRQKLIEVEADATTKRMGSVQPGFIEALVASANAGILEKVTPQLAALAFVNGNDTEAVIGTLLKGTAAEGILDNLKGLTKVRK